MNNIRRWDLDPTSVQALVLAADARLSRTSYSDDQTWRLRLGEGDSPALALQTQYGMRAGLVSLVPIWTHEGHAIYQTQTYQQAPRVTHFAPNLMHLEGAILPDLTFEADYIALDSQTVGVRFVLTNSGQRDITLRADIYGHAIKGGEEIKLGLVARASGGHALFLGDLGVLKPVVLVAGGNSQDPMGQSPRVGRTLTIPAGKSVALRFVHSGQDTVQRSLHGAERWLTADWDAILTQIDRAALAIPQIQTGDLARDAAIALSYNRLVQAFLKPSGAFPRSTFVGTRIPAEGYSPRGDGRDHGRGWRGQDPLLAYLVAPAIASIDPALAQGVVRNYLASQGPDGGIDQIPGPAGQRVDMLCLPLLARLTWHIYQQTHDVDFLRESFGGLLKFLERWLASDLDADDDGAPEWQDERQTGYVAFPTFAPDREWSQGADIRLFETPDLLAYLLSEANSLLQIAVTLGEDEAQRQMNRIIEVLGETLAEFWDGQRYTYRDRDTHITGRGVVLLEDAPGDVSHTIYRDLTKPNRVIVRIEGGVRHVPNATLHVEGRDADDNPITETVPPSNFVWQRRVGLATTTQVFSQVDTIRCDGLSRVYTIDACTADTTGSDINGLLPLWGGAIPQANADQLAQLALDKDHFRQPNGITMVSAQSDHFDPSNAEGAGGIWLYWLTLVAEGLMHYGQTEAVGDLLKDLLDMQTDILTTKGKFGQFYHTQAAEPLGDSHHLSGIVPLYLLGRAFGVSILSHDRVWTGGPFAWGRSVTIRQHGVYVRRTRKQIKVRFASGHEVTLDGDAPWQEIVDPQAEVPEDPTPIKAPDIEKPEAPASPAPAETPGPNAPTRIIIEVEHED